jgi:hypothetical protein
MILKWVIICIGRPTQIHHLNLRSNRPTKPTNPRMLPARPACMSHPRPAQPRFRSRSHARPAQPRAPRVTDHGTLPCEERRARHGPDRVDKLSHRMVVCARANQTRASGLRHRKPCAAVHSFSDFF